LSPSASSGYGGVFVSCPRGNPFLLGTFFFLISIIFFDFNVEIRGGL
jgi:hypothetical protein